MAKALSAIPVAVIGAGKMGRVHAQVYRDHPRAQLKAVVDLAPDRARDLAAECACKAYKTLEELLAAESSLGAVSVAVPTTQHAEVALPLIKRGIPCLIEKALAHNSVAARKLLTAARTRGTIVMAGHSERFNPAVQALVTSGDTPVFLEVERVSPMTFRGQDVDVIFDLMIHDIDLTLWLTGRQPEEAHIEAFGLRADDEPLHLAKARLTFDRGPVVDLTASRLALASRRRIRLFGKNTYVRVDPGGSKGSASDSRVVRLRSERFLQGLDEVRRRYGSSEGVPAEVFARLVGAEELPGSDARGLQPLDHEIDEFLAAVLECRKPTVDIEAGVDAVVLAERIVASISDSSLLHITRGEAPSLAAAIDGDERSSGSG